MSTGLERIRELVREKPDRKLQTLMHLVNTKSLRSVHEKQKTGKATGVDKKQNRNTGKNWRKT